MDGEPEKWILMVTARTPTNIALISDNISVTLDPNHLCTTTTVSASPSFDRDRMWLNGEEISLEGGRFQSCLGEIRARAQDVEDKKKGIKIKKEDWQKLHLHIASYNNFPAADGLACLVFSLAKLMNLKEDNSQLSAIARQGSDSDCRSLHGGFVKWIMGKEDDGSDSLAVQLADEKHWDELVIIIAVETSSTSGMRDTLVTSPLIQHGLKEIVSKRIVQMENAIKNRDFPSFARLACTDTNPIFYTNDTSHRIISCVEKWNCAEGTPQVAYTFDAGPNTVMIARNRKTAALLLQRLLYIFPPQSDTNLDSYIIGDKSILEDGGIKDMKNVEGLTPPPEVKQPTQKSEGDVSYFICTRPGGGPVVLSDETQPLLDPLTGLPSEIEEMDRISQLPDFIIHHILSFLTCDGPPSELVRMSVLSKTWFHLTASFPILDFDIESFTSRESFFTYVEHTTSRFCHQNVTADRFSLFFKGNLEPAELDIVDRCLGLLLRNGVKELVIGLLDPEDSSSVFDKPNYRLTNIPSSVSVLESLTIYDCDLLSSFMLDAVKFNSLLHFKLEFAYIDAEMIKYITTSCPLLQKIEMNRCYGFKRFCVHGHQNLQRVSISFDPFTEAETERIDIEAPNLSYLRVTSELEIGPPQMKLASCKKLTTVFYEGYLLPNSNDVTNFLSNFPFLENLVLHPAWINIKGDNLKLSNHSLRTLELHSRFDLDEIELNTPNLGLFVYTVHPAYSALGMSDLPHLKACMRYYPYHSIDFQKLRLFLDKESGFKALNLYICTDEKSMVLEKLNAIELPPYELEHIELHFDYEESPGDEALDAGHEEKSSFYAAFVDAVLCCFRPRSLTLRSSSFPLTDFEEQSALVKFTYEKLFEQENQGHTNIEIVSPYSLKAQKQFRGLMLLPQPPPCEEKAISFIKKEGKRGDTSFVLMANR